MTAPSPVLYNSKILRLATSIAHHERLPAPDASAERRSPVCGSRVIVDVTLREGRVAALGQEVRACALGQAAASLMAAHAIGQTVDGISCRPIWAVSVMIPAIGQGWMCLRQRGPTARATHRSGWLSKLWQRPQGRRCADA
jgi:hypothetical protein